MDTYLKELWEEIARFEIAAHEDDFDGQEPPPEHHLRVESDLAVENIGAALNEIPMRWRADIAMCLYVYLTVDLEFPDDV